MQKLYMEGSFDPKKSLLLIAHHDDEVLSTGGLIARFGKGMDIVCATYKPIHREYETIFNGICAEVEARSFTLDIPNRDENKKLVPLTPDLVCKSLAHFIPDFELRYDTIITHHMNGDLGCHRHHKQLACTVRRLFSGKAIFHIAHTAFVAAMNHPGVALTDKEHAKKTEWILRYKPWHTRPVAYKEYYELWQQ